MIGPIDPSEAPQLPLGTLLPPMVVLRIELTLDGRSGDAMFSWEVRDAGPGMPMLAKELSWPCRHENLGTLTEVFRDAVSAARRNLSPF